MTQFAWTLSNNSVVEWFWLIELFSVLSSVLISVRVFLCGPAGTIPEGGIHHVAGAIIDQRLSWTVQVRFILDVLVNLNGFLIRELF